VIRDEHMLRGPQDDPKTLPVTLSGTEYAALVYLRDTLFPGRSYELLARKLIQDALIASGVLRVPGSGEE
jgi:hypothetical protein